MLQRKVINQTAIGCSSRRAKTHTLSLFFVYVCLLLKQDDNATLAISTTSLVAICQGKPSPSVVIIDDVNLPHLRIMSPYKIVAKIAKSISLYRFELGLGCHKLNRTVLG